MKNFLLIACLGLTFASKAQTIESGSHSTTGYVKSDGTIENSSHSTKGYIKSGRYHRKFITFYNWIYKKQWHY